MTREEIVDIIRSELARQLQAILVGKTKKAAEGREHIESIYPGAPTIEDRPVMHPYGFRSRAKEGTTNVVAVQGAHAANRIILGHRDANAPEPDAEGAVVVYDAFGNSVHLKDGKIVVTLDDKMEIGASGKDAARKGDSVKVTITPDDILTLGLTDGTSAITATSSVDVTGEITSGSGKVTITD